MTDLERLHELKIWPEHFDGIVSGRKTFEVRVNDRDYHEGDLLRLREWNPESEEYSGDEITVRVTCVCAIPHTDNLVGLGIASPADDLTTPVPKPELPEDVEAALIARLRASGAGRNPATTSRYLAFLATTGSSMTTDSAGSTSRSGTRRQMRPHTSTRPTSSRSISETPSIRGSV